MKLTMKRLKLEMTRYRVQQKNSHKIKNIKLKKIKNKLRSIYWQRIRTNLT